ncbi:hypothetical protein SAMN05216311_10324 [Chitinophaga sp. CF418]|nr:hypothetical protein SAMN05216311_10324 [Chitinophaga sp. CF418]
MIFQSEWENYISLNKLYNLQIININWFVNLPLLGTKIANPLS